MNLRQQLVTVALQWQDNYGVAPHITSALSEFDAAMLVGCTEKDYSNYMRDKTAVSRGTDFVHDGKRYQVKANRPSGKRGSRVTLVSKARNYAWDCLIWVLYNKEYDIQEAWLWPVDRYRSSFEALDRVRPIHMRKGQKVK